jgi:hypothetical protein
MAKRAKGLASHGACPFPAAHILWTASTSEANVENIKGDDTAADRGVTGC